MEQNTQSLVEITDELITETLLAHIEPDQKALFWQEAEEAAKLAAGRPEGAPALAWKPRWCEGGVRLKGARPMPLRKARAMVREALRRAQNLDGHIGAVEAHLEALTLAEPAAVEHPEPPEPHGLVHPVRAMAGLPFATMHEQLQALHDAERLGLVEVDGIGLGTPTFLFRELSLAKGMARTAIPRNMAQPNNKGANISICAKGGT